MYSDRSNYRKTDVMVLDGKTDTMVVDMSKTDIMALDGKGSDKVHT